MIAKETSRILTYQAFENAPLPVVICQGREMLIQFANRLALPLLRMSDAESKGKRVAEVFPDIFTEDITGNIIESCLVRDEPYIIRERQLIYVHDDKLTVTWFDVTTNPVYDEQGSPAGVIIYFSDVSNRVIVGKSIDQREAYLSNFFRQAPIGLVCYRGADFVVAFANDKALEMWGKTINEVKNKPVHEIFPEVVSDPVIRARHAESLQRLQRGETHVVNEVELTFVRNGKPRPGWYNYIHEPYTDSAGKIVGMLAIAIEVTEQVLARKKLQMVTDALPSLVSYINVNQQYELVNKAYETWFKRPRAEVVGKTIPEVVGKEAYGVIRSHVDKVLAGETDSFESWIEYADGKRRYVSANYIPHVDNNDRVLGYVGLVNDLTERKKHEEFLFENEARLRLIIEGVGAGTFDYDLKVGHINWSNELKLLLGIPRDQSIDAEIARSVVHPDDLEGVLQQSKALQDSNSSGYMAMDYRIVKKDSGEIRWLHTRSKLLYTVADGERIPTRIIGFSIDITDRKIAEEKLRVLSQNLEVNVRERTDELVQVNDLLQRRNEDLHKAQSVLQQIIDSSVELIAVVDRNLKFLAVNKTLESFIQKSKDELIGKEITVAYAGVTASQQMQLIQRAFAGETLHLTVNPSISRPNVWFDTHYVPLKIDGKVEGVIALSRDITDIVKSQQELADVNRQLSEAQHLSKLGSWEWDVTTGTVIWSDEMYRIYGYEEKFAVDFVKATERMSPADADRSSKRTQEHIQRAIENFRNNGETVYEIPPVEFQIRLPDGQTKILRNTGRIQLSAEGKMHRILGVVQDVTQIRSAEEKLRHFVEELKIKNLELESFNYIASHDLKEPLRNIRTMIDLIRLKGTEDHSVYLDKIDRAAERMAYMIESILKFSEVSNSDFEFSVVDLNKVLHNVKADLEARIKETRASIVSDSLPVISGHESQVSQVFSNLIANSMKFCKRTPAVRITCVQVPGATLRTSFPEAKADQYWRLNFVDNGIGFDARFKQQIFEPFQRLHGKGEYSGTGIGLSIVKKIVERHNGYIDVTSEQDEGTTFQIYLPATL